MIRPKLCKMLPLTAATAVLAYAAQRRRLILVEVLVEPVAEQLAPGSIVGDLHRGPVVTRGSLEPAGFVESPDVGTVGELHGQFTQARHVPVVMAERRQGSAEINRLGPGVDVGSVRGRGVEPLSGIG